MKSEHRHELKTNELGKLTVEAGRYSTEHKNQLYLVGAIVAALLIGIVVFLSLPDAGNADGWRLMAFAETPEDYAKISDKYGNEPVGDWAKLQEANRHLENGISLSFTDRAAALQDLKEARTRYDALLAKSTLNDDVRERALYGLARVYETTSDGNNDEAIRAYEAILNQYPQTALRANIEQSIAFLKEQDGKDFYAWFHKQDPKPTDRSGPQDGGNPFGFPAAQPQAPVTLPEIPDRLQGAETPATTPEGTSGPETPVTTPEIPAPSTGETTPPAETPAPEAGTPPESTPPAGDAPPATPQ